MSDSTPGYVVRSQREEEKHRHDAVIESFGFADLEELHRVLASLTDWRVGRTKRGGVFTERWP